MQKLLLLAATVLAGTLMFKYNDGDLTMVDVTREMDLNAIEVEVASERSDKVRPTNRYLEQVFEMVREVEAFEERVRVAILPGDMSMARYIAEFLVRVQKTQRVEKIVLVAEEDVSKLVEMMEWYLGDVEVAVVGTDAMLDEEALVIGVTGFVDGAANSNIVKFHDEQAMEVLEHADVEGVEGMDVQYRVVVEKVMNHAKEIGAEETEITKHWQLSDRSYFFVNFYKGKNKAADRKLTVLAFGDMMLGRYVRTLMDQNGLDYVFEKMPDGFFSGADMIHANLEGPIKGKGRSGGTAMVFQFNEDVAPLLKKWGFDMVSIANNHAADAGWDGRDTTIAALEGSGVDWCGHPRDVEKESVYYGNVGETTYAFVCLHDVTFKLDDQAAVELIKEVDAEVDYVLVSIHWGAEYKHQPHWSLQVEPGRAFVDAGADFIIGHHPHVVENFEIYNGAPIFYSLGNFVFDQYWSTMTQEELSIGIVLGEDGINIYLFPMKSERSQSRLMTKDEYEVWIEKFIGYGEYDEKMKEMIRDGVIQL